MTGAPKPSVTVALPVLNEERHIDAALDAIQRQTYGGIIEILVVDGGSTDRTRELAARHARVRVLDNPGRLQAAAMNVALGEAVGEVMVRADGHSVLADDYVEQCIRVLDETGAAIVGGAWLVHADTAIQRGIATAIMSRFGFAAARFGPDKPAGPRDSVSFGAYRVDLARAVGGYDASVEVNEDAEFAHRMEPNGGVWFDPAIRFTYVPRATYRSLGLQFFRYGRGRAATVRRHPRSLSPRQLAAPVLVVGLVSPWRRLVACAYGVVLVVAVFEEGRRTPRNVPTFVLAVPVMHLSWGTGFLVGLLRKPGARD